MLSECCSQCQSPAHQTLLGLNQSCQQQQQHVLALPLQQQHAWQGGTWHALLLQLLVLLLLCAWWLGGRQRLLLLTLMLQVEGVCGVWPCQCVSLQPLLLPADCRQSHCHCLLLLLLLVECAWRY
jgi:hypothetical protein